MFENLFREKPLLLFLITGVTSIIFSSIILFVVFKNNIQPNVLNDLTINESDNVELSKDSADNLVALAVDVSGAVANPGIYFLENKARISDAISAAGGLSENADASWFSKNINLSKKLTDSEKVYIPFIWDIFTEDTSVATLVLNDNLQEKPMQSSSTEVPQATTDEQNTQNSSITLADKTNVNTASLEALDALVGIGPAYAQKIIDNRPYKDFEELKTKSGVPASTLDKNKDALSF